MTQETEPRHIRFADAHCTITVSRPAKGVVLVSFEGHDAGTLGDRPFLEISRYVTPAGKIELFIDARGGRSASLDVSSEWARWLSKHRESFHHVSMLTGSRFVQLSADFVRKFADLGDVMRIYTDPAAFESALQSSVASARAT